MDHTAEGCVRIEGSSELALACGLHDYLKYDCHVHYSWCGNQTAFPEVAPRPEKRRETRPPLPLRPYLNYCAFGYSLAWWDLERWEREIDFMALNGINLPLAVTGVESVWQATFRRLGVSERGIAAFLSGPAFLPWQWMDNLDGHAGPLPESWIESHRQLGREIVRRECAWGMNPILPGFSGHVPAEFAARHPEAEYLPESEWCNFPSVKVLDPADPWFGKITRVYMEELTALFGATHYYAIDLFHERMIPNRPAEFFATLGREISAILAECDPQAVWVMQAWTENADIIRAIPRERLLILDIGKHRLEATKGLFGAPTVHGMIHSFGGHTEIGGSLDGAVAELEAIRHYPNLIGAGVFPESINNNPVLFELFLENALSEHPIDVTRWLPGYVLRRYGRAPVSALKAWEHLHRHVYTGRRGDPFIAARPRLEPDRANAWAGFHDDDTQERFFPAWEGLLKAAAEHHRRIILASTSEVYGKSTREMFHEGDDLLIGSPYNSRWCYACSKLLDEFYLMAFHRGNALPGTVVRFFNTVGPRQTGRYGMVVPRFVGRALAGEPLQVYGDGNQSRCFCHVLDVVRALRALLPREESFGKIYNIGSQRLVTIRELAELVIARTGSSSTIEEVSYEKAYEKGFEDMRRRKPDIAAIRELTSWCPERSLEEIIDDVKEFLLRRRA